MVLGYGSKERSTRVTQNPPPLGGCTYYRRKEIQIYRSEDYRMTLIMAKIIADWTFKDYKGKLMDFDRLRLSVMYF